MFKHHLLACLFFLCAFAHGQELKGRVVDAQTKQPVPFATIFIIQTESGIESDSEGNFVYSGDLPSSFKLRVRASMFETLFIDTFWVENLVISLSPIHLDLEDVVVSVPGGKLGNENAFHVDRVALKDLNTIQSSSLPEAISKLNGVQSASSGPGIAKPVIRGFQGTRILTLANGVRVENQQWGSDHGMAINELGIGHVEVIKGPSSLLFGNDALGGIIFLVDEAYSNNNQWSLKLNSRGETVNQSTTNSFVFKKSYNRFKLMLGGLHTTAADYQLPNQQFAKDSRYSQIGGKINLGYSAKNWVSHFRYIGGYNRLGVVGHTHDSLPDPSSFLSDKTSREPDVPAQVIHNHIVSWQNKVFLKKNLIDVILSHSYNQLNEFEEKFTQESLKVDLHSSYLNAKSTIQINETLQFIPGIQAQYQSNQNDENILEQLLPNFQQGDFGFYTLLSKKFGNWTTDFGGRVDLRTLKTKEQSFSKNYSTYNFSSGVTRKKKRSTVHFNISSGTRLPHVSELLSDGAHHGSIRYEKGNRDLVQEQAIQSDLNMEWDLEHLRVQINPHYSRINNFVVLSPRDSTIDNLAYYEYEQVDLAHLYGIDVSLHYHPHFAHWLHYESGFSYVRAHENSGSSLPLIPQANLNNVVSARIKMNSKFAIEALNLQHEYYFPQNHVSTIETITGDYHLLNASVQCRFGNNSDWKLNVGAKNILNEAYINHLSNLKNIGVFSPGRSIYLSINFFIKQKSSK